MAVIHRVHKYDASHRNSMTALALTEMMQGKNKHRTGLGSSEHIVAVQYIDADWFIFTEEIVMGPVP